MRKIAVLTSGGDSPGMNAAVRAVTKSGINQGMRVYGIRDGYSGLIAGKIGELQLKDVGDTIQRGGTILGSARFPEFAKLEVQQRAVEILNAHGIEGIVVVGGDGSYKGALALSKLGIKCIGLPGTIDNDINSTEFTIGFDTALNTVMDAIDKLRDTSSSHHRVSIVEIMGRYCGDLTISAGIACGVEAAITPESNLDVDALVVDIKRAHATGKKHFIITITEHVTDSQKLAKEIEAKTGFETRATILGHIQRGGSPTAYDRILASRMGVYAVNLLRDGVSGVCVGIRQNVITHQPIDNVEEIVPALYNELKADLPLLI